MASGTKTTTATILRSNVQTSARFFCAPTRGNPK
jgi:hypothetical protein